MKAAGARSSAEEEGVQFRLLNAPVEILSGDGWVRALKVQRCELGEPDEKGRRRTSFSQWATDAKLRPRSTPTSGASRQPPVSIRRGKDLVNLARRLRVEEFLNEARLVKKVAEPGFPAKL